MNHTIYTIHRRINKPLEFRGLQAQYVWWLGGGVIGLLILFVLLHLCGITSWICLVVTGSAGAIFIRQLYRRSQKYGAYGLMKKRATRRLPASIRSRSRQPFFTGQ
ncbi:MAG TPA: DUF4133 domain-containing protein [Puia sp.]|uniref:DUF4133 domain-containing protein n=1 Tax=Puia sp. TaxID=2045100 RepID=UPI002CD6D8CA|nr:DUF4133 domain-containing protein [Puia sp.]HVU97989.1 DUF4133 domain-containing protein [Puia sp.]